MKRTLSYDITKEQFDALRSDVRLHDLIHVGRNLNLLTATVAAGNDYLRHAGEGDRDKRRGLIARMACGLADMLSRDVPVLAEDHAGRPYFERFEAFARGELLRDGFDAKQLEPIPFRLTSDDDEAAEYLDEWDIPHAAALTAIAKQTEADFRAAPPNSAAYDRELLRTANQLLVPLSQATVDLIEGLAAELGLANTESSTPAVALAA